MDPAQRKVLKSRALQKMTVDTELLDILQRMGVLRVSNVESIDSEDQTRKASKLLTELPSKGPDAYDALYKALIETDQGELADLLHPDKANARKQALEEKEKQLLERRRKIAPAKQEVNVSKPEEEGLPNVWPDENFIKNDDFKVCVVTDEMKDMKSKVNDKFAYKFKDLAASRGHCIIINNELFDTQSKRFGTDVDAERLKELFTQLKYTVNLHKNLTGKEILDITERERTCSAHGDSFVFIILTHGTAGKVLGTDGVKIGIDEIVNKFDGGNCQQLISKPKLFFIQACQGGKTDPGVEVPNVEQTLNDLNLTDQEQSDSVTTSSKGDRLIALSTVEGFASWRRADLGTWFMQALIYVFAKFSCQDELMRMMTKVNRLVSMAETQHGKKQTSEVRSTLQKDFYFFPGMK